MNTKTNANVKKVITINCNEKKQGYEVRFNFNIKDEVWEVGTTEKKREKLIDIVNRAFYNEETNRVNWFGSRQYYYAKVNTPTYERMAWLIKAAKALGYTLEFKELKRSMARPRKATK